MLEVDIRDLRHGSGETTGQLAQDDPLFEGLAIDLDGPVGVSGRLQRTGDEEFFWHGRVQGRIRGACRRCLTDVTYPLDLECEVLFSADPDVADDLAVFPVQAPVTRVDVRPAVREEIALAVTAFPLCREDCAGLCARCGADLNAGPCSCTAPLD
jgi:uncharacterized protein